MSTTPQWPVQNCGVGGDKLGSPWVRLGGVTDSCVTGRCPGGTAGIRLTGGNWWSYRYPAGMTVLNYGYAGIYFNCSVLDGNPATKYGIFNFLTSYFNWYSPTVGVTVRGDGKIDVENDQQVFLATAAGVISAGVTYLMELKAVASASGTFEVRLDGVVVAALSGSGDTRSAQNSGAGFDWVGIGSIPSIDFNDFYFNAIGYQGLRPCGTQFSGVTGITHKLAGGVLRSQLSVGGQPKGGFQRWKPLGQTTLSPPINVPYEPPVDGGVVPGALSEVVTILAAAYTDTAIQIPAGAVVYAVSVKVMLPIPGPTTSFSVGTAANTTRFSTANVSTALGSSDPGTAAAVGYTATASSIRLTMNGGSPATATGLVRVSISYITAS